MEGWKEDGGERGRWKGGRRLKKRKEHGREEGSRQGKGRKKRQIDDSSDGKGGG